MIALIVSPIVIGAIEKSEKAAFARSIDGIIESVRIDHSDDSFLAPREYYYEKTDLTLLTVGDKKRDEMVNINGQIDGNGFVRVDGEGNITIDKICNTKYCASGNEDDITITDNEDGTITDFDKNDPVITLNGKAIVYVELNGIYKEEGATARTKVGDKLEYTTEIKKDNKVVESVNTKEEGTYEITYTTTHNEKTVSVTRTVAVLEMTPVITITEPNPSYVKNQEILVSVSAIKPNTVSSFTVEIKKDGKSESKENITGLTKTLNLNTTGVYEVIVTVIDNNNHKKIASKTYKIDTTGPVITFNPEIVTLETEEVNNYNLLTGVTVKDNVDGSIEVTTTSVKTTGELLKTPKTYQITYTVSDKLGNTSTKIRTFVVADATKPVITITPNEQSTFVKTKTITISATDNIKLNSISYVLIKDGVRGASTSINNGGTVTINSTGNYQIEVTAIDSFNNTSVKTSGTYKIDTTVPTITFSDVTLKVTEVATYNLMTGVSAGDNSGINPTVTYEGNLSAIIGTQTVTYKVTDQAGNVTTKVRTFTIVEAEGPILNFSSISSNNKWVKAQNITVTATDNSNLSSFTYEVIKDGASQGVKNGTISGKSGSAIVALSATGSYSIKLTGRDQYGNSSSATSGTYKIDTIAPTLNIPGATTISNTQVPGYNLMTGVSASDNTGIAPTVTTSGTIGTGAGTYTITYKATDQAGNVTTKTRNITVKIAGTQEWTKTASYLDWSSKAGIYNDVSGTADGGFVIIDVRTDTIHKYNSSGAEEWTKTASYLDWGSTAGIYNDVSGTADGGFVIIDVRTDTIHKYNSSGAEEWTKTASYLDWGSTAGMYNAVSGTADGGFVIIDVRTDTIHKYNSSGAEQWTKTASYLDWGSTAGIYNDVSGTADGGFVIIDVRTDTIHKYNSSGAEEWTKTASYLDWGSTAGIYNDVSGTTDGGFVIIDVRTDTIHKYNSSGAEEWTKTASYLDWGSEAGMYNAVSGTADGGFVIIDVRTDTIHKYS